MVIDNDDTVRNNIEDILQLVTLCSKVIDGFGEPVCQEVE